jgi:hypothetical protein
MYVVKYYFKSGNAFDFFMISITSYKEWSAFARGSYDMRHTMKVS